jgi:putative salt-induced outer membrane protein YdiY
MIIKRQIKWLTVIGLAVTGAMSVRAQTPVAAAPAEEKKPKWASSATAGLTLTSGNSETFLASVAAITGRKSENNELSLGVDLAYGKTKDQTTGVSTRNADSYHAFAQYNRLFSERLYGYARVDGLYDSIASIKYRITLSPGLGYYFIKEKTADLCVEVGPSYVFDNLKRPKQILVGTNTVTVIEYQPDSYATLRAGEKFNYKLSDRARLWQTAEWLPQVEDFNKYIINFVIGVEADLTQDKRLTMSVSLHDTFNNDPATRNDGTPLEKNDIKLIAAIGYKF